MTNLTEARILEALRKVIDPDLNRDIVSLGFVRDVVIEDGTVRFRLVLTTPACPMKNKMKAECERVLMEIEGVRKVEVTLDAATCTSRSPEDRLVGVKNILLVGSGKGGVGKSTVAVNLAAELVRSGASVGLMDADIYGPSIPAMTGLHEPPRVIAGKMVPPETRGIKVMSIGFLVSDSDALVWRGPVLHRVLTQFVEDVSWGELDYLVVDLPPGTGDVQISLAQLIKPSGVLLVTTPQDISFNDVRRAATMFSKVNLPVVGLVVNMAAFVCPHCGNETEIFPCADRSDWREVSPGFEIEVLSRIPVEPQVGVSCEEGQPIVWSRPESRSAEKFAELAGKVVRRLSIMADKSRTG